MSRPAILVTGGAGYIGSHTCKLLSAAGYLPVVFDNLSRGNERSVAWGPLVVGNIRDRTVLQQAIRTYQPKAIIHFAALAYVGESVHEPAEYYSTNVSGTIAVLDAARASSIENIIFSSSCATYGVPETLPIRESSAQNPISPYGYTKLVIEHALADYSHAYGLGYAALRYFNAYGPRMDTDGKYTEVMIKWLDCIRDGRNPLIYGDGSTTMDFVYVRDIAKSNIAALQADTTDEAFNIGNCEETSLKELLAVLLKVNDSRLQPEYREENSVNPVSRRLADISKAKKLLHFSPTISLEQGMKELSEWYFEKNKQTVQA